jgi:hypothetical protein
MANNADVQTLISYGFKKVGGWELTREDINPRLDDNLKLLEERAIYAYTMDDKVMYIGICQGKDTTLEKRLKGHHRKNNEKLESVNGIYEGLRKDKKIEIYAWKPRRKRTYKWLQIDLVKGLESPLICRFNTITNGWNEQT